MARSRPLLSQAARLTPGFLLALGPLIATGQPTSTAGPDTVKYSLQETVIRVLEASPEVAAELSKQQSAEARTDLARASRFLTEFSFTSAHSASPALDNPNDTPTDQLYLDPDVRNDWESLGMFNEIEINALQPIYTWGQLGGSIRAAREAVAVEEASVEETRIEVAFRAAQSYYSLLLAEGLKRVANDAGDVVARAKREINRLLEEGAPDVDDADLFQVLITEQEFERRVVEVDERLRTAEMALRRQLFLPEDIRVAVADAYLTPIEVDDLDLEDYMQLALANRPEIEQALAGIRAREALVAVARSDFYPKLFAGGKYRLSTSPNRFRQPNPYISDRLLGSSLEAGVGFRLQLNFAQTKAKVERARAQQHEVEFQLEGLHQLIRFEVEDRYRGLRIARAAMEAQQEALRLSKEWLQLESVNFDLDLGDTENLVRAVQSNLQLQAADYQAVFEYNMAVMKLYRACGVLIDELRTGTLVGD
ncbi:MAG: TolC family protein [Rhodothermia bacterium]|nr:TolC family protein [Rhodothermia bacterium]